MLISHISKGYLLSSLRELPPPNMSSSHPEPVNSMHWTTSSPVDNVLMQLFVLQSQTYKKKWLAAMKKWSYCGPMRGFLMFKTLMFPPLSPETIVLSLNCKQLAACECPVSVIKHLANSTSCYCVIGLEVIGTVALLHVKGWRCWEIKLKVTIARLIELQCTRNMYPNLQSLVTGTAYHGVVR